MKLIKLLMKRIYLLIEGLIKIYDRFELEEILAGSK